MQLGLTWHSSDHKPYQADLPCEEVALLRDAVVRIVASDPLVKPEVDSTSGLNIHMLVAAAAVAVEQAYQENLDASGQVAVVFACLAQVMP